MNCFHAIMSIKQGFDPGLHEYILLLLEGKSSQLICTETGSKGSSLCVE